MKESQASIGFYLFLEEFRLYEHGLRLDALLDEFLDVYADWRKSCHPEAKEKAIAVARELMRLDPSFACNIERCFAETERVIEYAS